MYIMLIPVLLFVLVLGMIHLLLTHPLLFMLIMFAVANIISGIALLIYFAKKSLKKHNAPPSVSTTEAVTPSENTEPIFDNTEQSENTNTDSECPAPIAYTELTKFITDQIKVIFGNNATWRWKSSDDRDACRQGGFGTIFITTDTSITEAQVIPSKNTVEIRFVNFQPLPELKKNYSLLAFQWFEENFSKINTVVSAAVAAGQNEAVISPDMLPEKGAWDEVAKIISNDSDYAASVSGNGIVVNIGG